MGSFSSSLGKTKGSTVNFLLIFCLTQCCPLGHESRPRDNVSGLHRVQRPKGVTGSGPWAGSGGWPPD